MHCGAAVFESAPVPFEQLLVLFLERHGGRRVEYSSEAVRLLKQIHLMPAQGGLYRGLHAADSSADDRYALRVRRGGFRITEFIIRPWIQHAAAHLHVHRIDVRALPVQTVERQAGAVA